MPFFDLERQRTVWFRPEDLPDDPALPSILFLDELSAASPMLQPTVYGLLQERRVGPHLLPASCFVVAAGNTIEDGAIAHEMGTALSDRLIHLNLVAEADDWLACYAVPQGLHPAVIAFIRTRPDLLDTVEPALRRGDMIACTPRSWARVSAIMQAFEDRRLRNIALAGVLGEAVAAEFQLIADEIAATVQLDAMLSAPTRERLPLYPASMHGLSALVYALMARDRLEVNVLHDRNPQFVVLSDGSIRNGYTVKLLNKIAQPREVTVAIDGLPGAAMSVVGIDRPEDTAFDIALDPDRLKTVKIYVRQPRELVDGRVQNFRFLVEDPASGENAAYTANFDAPE